jgi:hypothetical protein
MAPAKISRQMSGSEAAGVYVDAELSTKLLDQASFVPSCICQFVLLAVRS